MSFVSYRFIIFFFLLLILYYVLPKLMQKYVLLVSSVIFYAFFGKRALAIVLATVLVSYLGAILIDFQKKKALRIACMYLFVVIDLLLLVSLKYVDVFRNMFSLVVPVGISFYTLSIISYLVDVYKKKQPAEKNVIDFTLFVLYFPHILQGPIARFDRLKNQFNAPKKADYIVITNGLKLALWGFAKKMIIADRLAIFVQNVYGDVYLQRGTTLFIASLFYSLQLYMDFSGCVDISRGVSESLGIKLDENFRQPYFADSINDFWRRWHLTLSGFFRDYLYIPLGGNKKGKIRRWMNVLIVFLVSGAWHGVGLNYVLWGGIHGLSQMIGAGLEPVKDFVTKVLKFEKERWSYKVLKMLITFLIVNEAWVFFRIESISEALYVVKESFCDIAPWVLTDGSLLNYGVDQNQFYIVFAFLTLAFIVDYLHEKGKSIREILSKQHIIIRWTAYLFALFSVILFGTYGLGYNAESFIYMRF